MRTETEEQVLKRLRNAKAEIEQGQSSGIFDHMLYNDNLEDCYQSLKKFLGLDGAVTAAPKSEIDFWNLMKLEHEVALGPKLIRVA
ncbi:hypothetical protein C1H46_003509 [Malus baccata]|uniref:Guanylate kinase-like domain-containing protein n=1 Tax=Malus baccata TaxID=106549 RepID=A0A540NIS8_MALBA|nr:hypothetical protein C1H46_003509 [Malus baccata]